MRNILKLTALVLTLAMLVTTLATPVLAYENLPSKWSNRIKAFSPIQKNVDSDIYEDYIKALQRYLMCFDYVCRNKLYYNGGYMDGEFGGRTESAVIYLQGQFGYVGDDIDGKVGPQTWGSIASSLKYYTENYNKIRRPNGVPDLWVFVVEDFYGIEELYYFGENNTDIKAI